MNIHRCQHIKVNGTQCGSPALKRNRFCFFHKRWHEQRILINAAKARNCRPALDLPVLEDANSIQVSLMQVMRLLLHGQLDRKTAGMLLYALQVASSNLRHTSFDPALKTRVVVDPSRVCETELEGDPWNMEDLYDEEEDEEEDEGGKQKDKEIRDDEVEELLAAMQRKPAAKNQPSPEVLRSEMRRALSRMLPAIPNRPAETAEPRTAKPPAEVGPPASPACRDIPAPTAPAEQQTASKRLLHLAKAAGIAAFNARERALVAEDFFSLPTSRTNGGDFREGS